MRNRFAGFAVVVLLVLEAATARAAKEAVGEATPEPVVAAKPTKPEVEYGIGARLRYVFIPRAVLELFLDHATSLGAMGLGAEFVRRRGDFEIVAGLEYDSLKADSGLYQEKGKNIFSNPPDFTTFDGFGMFGLDVSFLWNHRVHEKVTLRYGAGVGLGFILGDIMKQKTQCLPGTTVGNLDSGHCPVGAAPPRPRDDVLPVVPIINASFGARVKVHDRVHVNVDAGIHDVFFLGLSSDYSF